MATASTTFVKQRPDAPEGFFETEAAGLRWLGAAGGADVVEVLDVASNALTLERLTSGAATAEHAQAFGAALARTHDAGGAEAFGALPPGASHYFFGPLDSPIDLPTTTNDDFGTFYAGARLRPLLDVTRHALGPDADLLASICTALEDGAADLGRSSERPARVHGDLWSGNVMWTPTGAVLIDPAACGHHRLADIAMLMLFGAPQFDAMIAGYESAHPLRTGWREEIPLHQLFGYLVHLHLFGRAYLEPTRDALLASADLLDV